MLERAIIVFSCVTAVAVACNPYPDFEGPPLPGTASTTDPNSVDPSCSGPAKLDAVDPSTLPPCCDGTAHCLANDKVPGQVRQALAPCDPTSVCVPDAFLRSGGAPAPTCTAFNNAPGACISTCVPDVSKNGSVLQQGTCATGERCTPCINPLDNQSTGVCEIGKDTGQTCADGGGASNADAGADCPHMGPPVLDPTTYPSCAVDAHCLPSALVSPSDAADLATCTGGYCVPDVFIRTGGRYIPATCASIGDAEGRCLSAAIPKIGAQQNLPQSTCATGERCAPCYDPIDGSDTGACHHACDPGPTKPGYLFPTCCVEGGSPRGRCVPATSVPAAEQPDLSSDVCASKGDLCVPTENLAASFKPVACTAPAVVYLGSYSGVCLSDCLTFSGIQKNVIKQGTCDALHQCVPCKTPLGMPTGAPGCP